MKVYETGNIRNVVVMGHGGCGKTTLVEAIAYQTGITARMGKVTDGNTISDYDKEEQKRQFSISTSVVPVEFEDIKNDLTIAGLIIIHARYKKQSRQLILFAKLPCL